LHTSRCWEECIVSQQCDDNITVVPWMRSTTVDRTHALRTAELRIAGLIRCMDFSRPTPKMNIPQLRVMTCIFLDMVSITTTTTTTTTTISTAVTTTVVPKPCQTLGMTWEEYNYLVRSCLLSFG
jgi:hypothetical protein